MDINTEKASLRDQIKQQSRLITEDEARRSDELIIRNVLQLPEYLQASVVFCFVGTSSEINTIPLLEDILAQKKCLAVPRCISSGIMSAFIITNLTELEKGAYGILEPKKSCPVISPDQIDFAVVPCIACDKQGNRLGKGGGYYDRFMLNKLYKTASICRKKFLQDHIPTEKWDQKVDIVITEEIIYRPL